MNIQDIRQKYPQYKDIPDQQLADAFHDKFYSDMPKNEFYSKIGFAAPQQSTAPTPAPKETVGGDLSKTAGNIIPSAVGVGTNIATAFRHPLQTGAGMLDVLAGEELKFENVMGKYIPNIVKKAWATGDFSSEQSKKDIEQRNLRQSEASNIANEMVKQRYGSLEKAKNTFINDPVGFLMDISSVAGVAGSTANIAGLSKTASTLGKVSRITDPVGQVAKVTKGVVRPAYEYTVGLTTGSGAEVIKHALKGGDAFTQAMRGHISETDVLDTARQALQTIKDERGAAYRSKLTSLKADKQILNIDDIKSASDNWLKQYNIVKTPNGLDFSRSTLKNNPAAANEVKTVYESIQDWGSKKGDLTPSGLDILKRQIGDTYTSTNPSRAMVQSLKSAVHNKIASAVPEYSKMTQDYAKASDIIDDMNRGLSLSDRAATDTALRKLMTAMREDKTFRRSLIDTLSDKSGKDVAGAVSGLLMKNPWSNRLGPIAHFYGTSAIAAYMHNPALIGLLPAASPRFMGEVSRGIGKAAQAVPKNRAFYMTPYQAGRLPGLYDDSSLK